MPAQVHSIYRVIGVLACASWAFAGCGTSENRGRAPITDSLVSAFSKTVIPVLERRCNSCHGLVQDGYDKVKLGGSIDGLLRWPVDDAGKIATPAQKQIALTSCRKLIDRRNPAIASALVAAALSKTYAGIGHTHVEVFASPDDPDYKTLSQWVEAERKANPKPAQPLTGKAERFFAERVVPILERKACMGSNCHGAMSFSDLKFRPGIPSLKGRYTPQTHRHNRLVMLGALKGQASLVHLSGDVSQSRQLVKNIPIAEGGILHKGGNHFFSKRDPEYGVLVDWLKLEAAAVASATKAPIGQERGFVFVRRPRATPERYFEDDAFMPGADLFWRVDGKDTNLTAALHPKGPADIRRPAVSYDAQRVAFAMRRTADEPFNIWELELGSKKARQLTFSTDAKIHFKDPLYVPDPDDAKVKHLDRVSLATVSNRAGEWAAASPDGILGEAESGTRTTIVDTARTEKAGTYDRRTIRIVRGTNLGQKRTITRQTKGRLVVDRPFEKPCDTTTHYVIDAKVRMAPSYSLYRMRLAPAGGEKKAFAETLVRMTYALGHIRRPHTRSTGEVMMTSLRTGWQEGRPFYNGAIFRVHDNGSDFHTHYGNRSVVPIIASNREMPNGLEVRIGRDADSYWGGTIMVADHQFGPPVDPANPLDNLDHPLAKQPPQSGLSLFFRGWVDLDDTVTTHGISPGGAYRDPYPMGDGSILVSYAKGPIDLSDPKAAPNFDIVRITPAPSYHSDDGLRGGIIKRTSVVAGPMSELWPTPVVVRSKAPFHKPQKWHKLRGKPGRVKSFVGYPDTVPSLVVVFDLVLLDAFFEQSAPAGVRHLRDEVCTIHGERMPDIDQIKYARIIGAVPQREGDVGEPKHYVIAELELASDESFQALVPPFVAFDIQALNGDRMALSSPRRWLYTHPGEKHTLSIPRTLYAQTCSGCHGILSGKGKLPYGRPDIVSSASRTVAMWDDAQATERKPRDYSKPGLQPSPSHNSFGFDEDIQPILKRRCVSCHVASNPKAAVDLSTDDAFENLRRYVNHREGKAIESFLMELLLGKELKARRTLKTRWPHPSRRHVTADELLTFTRWIDLGASRKRTQIP